ncbi:MAG: hypothetical protein O7B24_07635, partial [Alphaproteobacteria bacterium]|nr:hypothetical protein [Alphaproteobacteria bacterium]
ANAAGAAATAASTTASMGLIRIFMTCISVGVIAFDYLERPQLEPRAESEIQELLLRGSHETSRHHQCFFEQRYVQVA